MILKVPRHLPAIFYQCCSRCLCFCCLYRNRQPVCREQSDRKHKRQQNGEQTQGCPALISVRRILFLFLKHIVKSQSNFSFLLYWLFSACKLPPCFKPTGFPFQGNITTDSFYFQLHFMKFHKDFTFLLTYYTFFAFRKYFLQIAYLFSASKVSCKQAQIVPSSFIVPRMPSIAMRLTPCSILRYRRSLSS